MSIRFFGYFVGCRYLRFLRHESSRSKYLSPALSALASLAYVSTVPLDPRHGPRRISHITFRESPPPSPLPSSPPPFCSSSFAPSLLARPGSARSFQTLLRSREIAFKLFGFLTRRGFIVRNSRCIAYKVPVDLREVGRQPRGRRALLNFV